MWRLEKRGINGVPKRMRKIDRVSRGSIEDIKCRTGNRSGDNDDNGKDENLMRLPWILRN